MTRCYASPTQAEYDDLMHSLFANMRDVAYRMDMHGRLLLVSPSVLQLTGYSPAELRGQLVQNFTVDSFRFDTLHQRLMADGFVNDIESDIVIRDGSVVTVSASAHLLRDADGQPYAIEGLLRVITERKALEQHTLQESQQRFRAILEDSLDAAYRRNLDTDTYDYMSPVIESLIGFTAEALTRMSVGEMMDHIHPDDHVMLAERLHTIIASADGRGTIEYRFRHRNGAYVWLADYLNVMRDAEGSPRYIVGIVRDVSERRQAEEALRESEGKFRSFFQQSQDGIILIDTNGTIIEWNDGEELITGIPRSKALGQPLWEIQCQLAPERLRSESFRQRAKEKIMLGLQEGRHVQRIVEDTIQRPDGDIRTIQSKIFIINTDGKMLAGGITRDITERKQAEEALRESEGKFHLLADMIQVAIIIVQDGRIQYANPYLLQHGGYLESDLLGQSFLRIIHPDYHALLTERNQRRLLGEAVPEHYEVEAVNKDGGYIGWYDILVTVIEYQGCPAVLATAQDITARKQTEKALLEADYAKDEFLAVLSHELQTPLTSMLGWSAEALRAGTPELMSEAMVIVHRNAVRQKRLVDELLDISRLIHQKIMLALERIDLAEEARLAVENLQNLAHDRQLRLIYEPASTPLPIYADAVRIQQCLANLLQNSLKFTPNGGSITVRCWRDGDQVLLAVEDTGRGMPPDALPALFQLFHQVHRDERTGGLGLGLAITHRIVELHGGNIRAESEGLGHGSRFTISLPIANTS